TRCKDCFSNFSVSPVVAPNLKTRCSGHTVPQRPDAFIRYIDMTHPEKLHPLHRAAIELFNDGPCVGPLNLKTPVLPVHRPAHRVHGRTAICFYLYIRILTLGCVISQPIPSRRTADEQEFILTFAKQDAIADDESLRRGRHVLFCSLDGKVGDTAYRGI